MSTRDQVFLEFMPSTGQRVGTGPRWTEVVAMADEIVRLRTRLSKAEQVVDAARRWRYAADDEHAITHALILAVHNFDVDETNDLLTEGT
jgi:hypothetical protein